AYVGLLTVVGVVFVFMTIAEATRLLPPTLTVDVAANLIFGIPVLLLPLILFWKGRGEQRSRLQLAAELTLIYIPLTAGSQLTYE
ncbi:emopamil-binding protein, partial [Mycobacterium tuberculosis]|nr:emopamil-binding protein [Mycobacterium tuberculosis]